MLGQLPRAGNVAPRTQLAAADQTSDLLPDLLVKWVGASNVNLNGDLNR